jgi:putative transposase
MYLQGVSTRKVRKITEERLAATPSRPRRSPRSTSGSTRASPPSPPAGSRSPSPTSSSTPDTSGCAKAASCAPRPSTSRSASTGTGGGRSSASSSLPARAARPGGTFPRRLIARGLHGVEFAVADDHAGLRAALRETLPEAAYQRCYVHFLRNALDHLPRKADETACARLALALRPPRPRRGPRRSRRLADEMGGPLPAPKSCGSSPTPRAASGSSVPSPSKPTRTGSGPTAI